MLDFDAHAQLADATAELMRSCAIATAQTMTTSACRGLTLWSEMLRAPVQRPGSASNRDTMANPFETLWRLTSAGWMPKVRAWPLDEWLPSSAPVMGWNPYAAVWGRSPYAAWTPLADWSSWGHAYRWPTWTMQPATPGLFAAPAAISQAVLRYASPSAYASYRSAGGHAMAQVVIAPVPDTVVARMAATAAFTPMQTMLGVWRTVLGV